MSNRNEYFKNFLNAAREDALHANESKIFALRYGLPQGPSLTLADIAEIVEFSREWIRNILVRSSKRIIEKAKSEVENNLMNNPCARLASFISEEIGPGPDTFNEKLYGFLIREFDERAISFHLVNFLSELAFINLGRINENTELTWQIIKKRLAKSRRQGTAQSRVEKLLGEVEWPDNARTIDPQELLEIVSQGEKTSKKDRYFHSDKMDRGVVYQSILEKKFYQILEYSDNVISYHSHPFQITYKDADAERRHYPDLLVMLNDHRTIIIEIIPAFYMPLRRNLAVFDGIKAFCKRHGYGFLVTDGYSTIQKFKKYRVKGQYKKEVLQYLRDNGSIGWEKYSIIKDKYGANRDDLVGLIIQNGLVWNLNHFKLSLSVQSKTSGA